MAPDQLREALADLKGNIARAVGRLPKHQAFPESYVRAKVEEPA
jgi:tryptophan halogenase